MTPLVLLIVLVYLSNMDSMCMITSYMNISGLNENPKCGNNSDFTKRISPG